MKNKGLLLDYDGTAVRRERPGELPVMSERVQQALKRISKQVRVGFCTGRKFWDLRREIERAKLKGPHVVCGGAQVIEGNNKVVWEKLIEPDKAWVLWQWAKKKKKFMLLKQGKYMYVSGGNKYFREYYGKEFLCRKIEDLKNWQVPEAYIENISEEEAEKIELMGLQVARQRQSIHKEMWFVDITAHGVTKQEGVMQWLRYIGLSREEVVGVGDGYNDIPMLNAVGLKIAMGNAVEEVKAMADFTAPSVDEDGVAVVVEKFF